MPQEGVQSVWSALAQVLPSINAGFNLLSTCLLWQGRQAILARDASRHKKLMLAALTSSTLFLVGYLTRFALTGSHRFEGPATLRLFYLVLLMSHMVLAVLLLPLLLRVLQLAFGGRFAEHRKMAKLVWPIWMYVSVTGVIVYGMLYHLAPRLTP